MIKQTECNCICPLHNLEQKSDQIRNTAIADEPNLMLKSEGNNVFARF